MQRVAHMLQSAAGRLQPPLSWLGGVHGRQAPFLGQEMGSSPASLYPAMPCHGLIPCVGPCTAPVHWPVYHRPVLTLLSAAMAGYATIHTTMHTTMHITMQGWVHQGEAHDVGPCPAAPL